MKDAKHVVEGFFSRSTSKYSSLISKNSAELDNGLLPEGTHRGVQYRQININENLFENVIILI